MPISTSELLEELEFRPFEHPFGCEPAYRRSFGPFEIEAAVMVNKWFRRGYMLSGIIKTDRTISSIEGELPLEIASREEGLALLSYFLARHIPEIHKPPWLRIGERMGSELPWSARRK